LKHDTERDDLRTADVRHIIHAEVYLLWAGMNHIFPRFCNLTVHMGFFTLSRSPMVLNMLLGSRVLTSLSIIFDMVLPMIESAILDCRTKILETCPHLEYLKVSDMGFVRDRLSRSSLDLFNEMLSRTINLRTISTNVPPKLEHLSRNRRLRELRVVRMPDSPHALKSISSCAFQSLSVLDFEDPTQSAMLSKGLLDIAHKCHLIRCTLHLTNRGILTSNNLLILVQQLATYTSLRAVDMMVMTPLDSVPSITYSTKLFSKLHKLNLLECFRLFPNPKLPIDNDILNDLLSACPRLRSWHVAGHYCQMSFQAFTCLLECRPDLRQLPISIYGFPVPPTEPDASFGTYFYGPMLLSEETEEKAMRLQDFIKSLFPHVPKVEVKDGDWRIPIILNPSELPRPYAYPVVKPSEICDREGSTGI
jgi:hypothetical protein